jgi:hypothetical protein
MMLSKPELHLPRTGLALAALALLGLLALPASVALAAPQSEPGDPLPGTPEAQDPEEAPAPEATPEELKVIEATALAVVETLRHSVEERQMEPIVPALTQLDGIYTRIPPKTLKKVVKAINTMFAKLIPREEQDIDTLGEGMRNGPFGPDDGDDDGDVGGGEGGPSVLLAALKQPHIRIWPEVQVLILEGLGYRGEAALEKEFEAYLRHANTMVASAAAGGLSRLREQPMEVRRRATAALVDAFAAAKQASEKEAAKVGEDDERPARAYLSGITVAYREALTSLTRQTWDKPGEWSAWFAEHGKDPSW